MEHTKDKVTIRCKHCNHRIFDYIAGDMVVEIKCSKCKKTIGTLRFIENVVRDKAINGEYRV